MAIKGWGVDPFNSERIALNASSRVIQHDMDNSVPRYRLEADRESLEFYLNLPSTESFEWITFTNTGKYPLRDLSISSVEPFIVGGGIPAILRPGESFKVRVKFFPEEPRSYSSTLQVRNEQLVLLVPLRGIWKYLGLIYDGTARHNGRYFYELLENP